MKYKFLVLLLIILSCKEKQPQAEKPGTEDTLTKPAEQSQPLESYPEKFEYQDSPFVLIKNYSTITDTLEFINALKSNCHLVALYPGKQSLLVLKNIRINGSDTGFFFVEYNWGDGPNSQFPWKRQFLFTKTGTLVKILDALRFEFINIFPGKYPFLVTTVSTAHGNGGHAIYKIDGDSLQNVFDGFKDYFPRTYDADHDNNFNNPYEMKLGITDINKDGLNDISFTGTIMHATNDSGPNYKAVNVRFNFIYDPKTGHFTEQEDYSKKYTYLENY